LLIFIPAALILLGDQFTKALIARAIPVGESRVVWPGFFALTHIRNAGAAFGILQFQTWLFIGLGVALAVAVFAYREELWSQPWLVRLGLGFALGGTLGNFVDRVRFGWVRDFLDFYYWPVFNLADMAIVCGAGLILLVLFRAGKTKTASGTEG